MVSDLLFIAGVIIFLCGVYCIYPPIAIILLGIAVAGLSFQSRGNNGKPS